EKIIVEIDVKVIAPAGGGHIENIIRAASDNGDDDIEDRERVKAKPDGSITKVADTDEVRVDDEYIYAITIENSAKATATWKNVTVTDLLPAELDFVSAVVVEPAFSSIDPEYDPLTGTITIECGDIAPEGVVIVEIMVKVNDAALAKIGDKIKNKAIAKSDNDDDQEDEDEKPKIKSKADSSIKKEASVTEVHVGDEYTYTITLTNSPDAIDLWKNVVMIDELPNELEYISHEIIPNGRINDSDIDITGQLVTMNCGDIDIGETVTIKITVKVTDTALTKIGEKIKNTAIAASDNDEDKDDDDEKPEVKSYADSSIKKEASVTEVRVGDIYTYTITLANSAEASEPWKNVEMTDILPAELEYQSHEIIPAARIAADDIEITGQVVKVKCGDIAIDETVVIKITVKVTAHASTKIGEKIKNTAVAASDNDRDKESTDEKPEIKKTDTSGPGGGSNPTYSVTYNANGGTGEPYVVSKIPSGNSHKVLGLTPTGISRTGYTFLGWNTKADGTGTSYAADASFAVYSDVVLYAQWSSSNKESQLDTENHFAYIIGYPDGTVQPQGNITRAEVATIFFRLLTQSSRAAVWSKTNDFPDVPANAWFNNAISTLTNAKILTGYPDGSFKPKNNITRAELAAIAVRFASEEEIEAATAKNGFSDISCHWAEEFIITASALGYVNGYPDGTFRPSTPITRAEVATLINNVLNRHLDSPSDLHSNMKTWPDNQTAAWYYLIMQEATNSHHYERKADGINEIWTSMRTNPDWVALEKPTSQPGDVDY
ncbi:MAG: DUF11 domain-containing protein, partial [Clostridiales bacterium]|nr:DUF11 domain-containing protein [Clostridiales bacterium]